VRLSQWHERHSIENLEQAALLTLSIPACFDPKHTCNYKDLQINSCGICPAVPITLPARTTMLRALYIRIIDPIGASLPETTKKNTTMVKPGCSAKTVADQ
jgi:hypothetical protein